MVMIEPVAVPKFVLAWLPSLAVSAVVPDPDVGGAPLGQLGMVVAGGVHVPLFTCALGLLGIALARPLARKGEAQLSWIKFALVSAIMLILAELWIITSQPGPLFAFVVSVGLGFAGYTLIELLGEEVKGFLRGVIDRAKTTLGPAAPQDGDRQ